jgi:two-component system response regulator EvgA
LPQGSSRGTLAWMPVRVLIVDDDSDFRAMAKALLTNRGYRVVGETDGVAATHAAIDALALDAILLDLNLPDGDGLHLAAQLCATGRPPRILLTSAEVPGPPPSAVDRCGAAGFVAKTELANTDLALYLEGR